MRFTSGCSLQNPPLLQQVDHSGHALLQILGSGVEAKLGLLRRFVGAGNAGELLDLPSAGLGLEALRVAGFTHRQISSAVDLEKITIGYQSTGLVTVGAEG